VIAYMLEYAEKTLDIHLLRDCLASFLFMIKELIVLIFIFT